MANLTYLNHTLSVLLSVAGIVLWGCFVALYPDNDAVSIYRLDRSVPTPNSFFQQTTPSSPASVAWTANMKLLSQCLSPDLYASFQALGSGFIAGMSTNTGSLQATITYANLQDIQFNAWNPRKSNLTLPYSAGSNTAKLSPQHYPPVCRCIGAVLQTYSALGASNPANSFDQTTAALQACVGTRHHIPRQTLYLPSGSLDTAFSNRKSISRSGFLFMICAAMLINWLLKFFDKESDEGWGIMQIIFIILLVLSLWLVPLASRNANLIAFLSLMFFPGLAVMIFIEWACYNNEMYQNRFIYMHPYVFYVTLMALYMLAAVENGVFTDENLMSYLFFSIITTLCYTSILFYSKDKITHESIKSGYILLVFISSFTVVLHLIAMHPVSASPNYLWYLPMIFVGFTYAEAVVLENLVNDETTADKFSKAAHLLSMGYSMVVLAVILYFGAKLQVLMMGDRNLMSANDMTLKLNFELMEMASPRHLNHSAPLGTFVNPL